MIVGAAASIILDYAAVAAIIGLFVLVRWSGIRLGRTLDLLLLVVCLVVVALSVLAWLVGSRFDLRLTHDMSAHAKASSYSHGGRQQTNSSDA
jgi:hypothetical protein